MSVFPAEVWHMICSYLLQDDLASLRLSGKALSNVAAEYHIASLRIDPCVESFERLRYIADHPYLGKGVKKLTYEAGLIANIGCIHRYRLHYENKKHDDLPAPIEPIGEDATPRALRRFERAENKFVAQIKTRYADYQALLQKQESIKPNVITASVAKLQLDEVHFRTGGNTCHPFSDQFERRYLSDCAIPLSVDPDITIPHFLSLLVPGLQVLDARQISIKSFCDSNIISDEWLVERFLGLKNLTLFIRQSQFDDGTPEPLSVTDSKIAIAVAAALQSLERLVVDFTLAPTTLFAGDLRDLITVAAPNLQYLSVDSLTSTEDHFVQTLKDMPRLEDVCVADIQLTKGLWVSTARRLRNELNLNSFFTSGILEDNTQMAIAERYDRDMWMDGERFLFMCSLDMYVTFKEARSDYDSDEMFEICCNPFYRLEDFDDEEDLIYEFGDVEDDLSDISSVGSSLCKERKCGTPAEDSSDDSDSDHA